MKSDAQRAEDRDSRGPSLAANLRARGLSIDPGLVDEVYRELRRIASNHLRRERAGHTLRTTALVHEAWLRLADGPARSFQDQRHFLATVSLLVRRILVDHARGRAVRRRAEESSERPSRRLAVDGGDASRPLDLLALDAALCELEGRDQRSARVVDLRFFGGLSVEQTAETLGVSAATVKRDWEMARAWLYRRIHG